MLSFAGALKVFVALEPVDLRKSFCGLEGLVSERLGEDLRQGALFVFTSRRHTRLKILYWDGTGLWLLIKRLEQGTFAWPKDAYDGRIWMQARLACHCGGCWLRAETRTTALGVGGSAFDKFKSATVKKLH